MTCQYCESKAELVDGVAIYGPYQPKFAHKQFWLCKPCGAYVGCHEGTTRALGRLANSSLRKARMEAHAAFDPFWRERNMTRRQGYRWLADQLGITPRQCHIAFFDEARCHRVVAVVRRAEAKEPSTAKPVVTPAASEAQKTE